MLSSKSLTVWLVVLFVSYCSSAPSANNALGKTLSQHYKIPNDDNLLFHLLSSYNETHTVFGYCGDIDSKMACRIIETNWNTAEMTFFCDITIKDSKKYAKFSYNATVALLQNDRALVLLKESQKMKLINVNFHGCRTNEVEIGIDEDQNVYAVDVLAYENSYDIFLANSKLCQKRSCRITFDNEGKVVKDIAPWGDEIVGNKRGLRFMRTVAEHSPVNGFIIQNPVNGDFVVNNEGHKLLALKEDREFVTVSTIGNYIGLCLNYWIDRKEEEEIVECKQFDFEGKLVKTEVQVNASSFVDDKQTIYYMTRLNLPDGFILFTVLCPYSYYGGCPGFKSYIAYRFDGNGKMLKAIEMHDFQTEHDLLILFPPRAFQNDAGQRCFLFIHYIRPVNHIWMSARCFTDDEL